jgi:hypothetical protein
MKITQREETLRRRVVHGWAFRDLTPEQEQEIRDYLEGGPIPKGYEAVHETVMRSAKC